MIFMTSSKILKIWELLLLIKEVIFIRDAGKQNCYIDLDGVLFDTVASINRLYHEDFKYYDGYEEVDSDDINTWEFAELKLASREYINNYFNQQRFFDNLILFDGVRYSISALSDKYNIIFVSMGDTANLNWNGERVSNWKLCRKKLLDEV